ncbi:MAG: 30S ribosomal protein S7, partial [Ignavibacteria bacterium]
MRKKRAEKRYAVPDPRFNDVMVSRFINKVMIQGKKNTARNLVYNAF